MLSDRVKGELGVMPHAMQVTTDRLVVKRSPKICAPVRHKYNFSFDGDRKSIDLWVTDIETEIGRQSYSER